MYIYIYIYINYSLATIVLAFSLQNNLCNFVFGLLYFIIIILILVAFIQINIKPSLNSVCK